MESQGRGEDFVPLAADPDAVYDETLEVNLSELEPLAAKPHSPDNVDSVRNMADSDGSGSHRKLYKFLLYRSDESCLHSERQQSGGKCQPRHLTGFQQGTCGKLASNGALADMIDAGARIIENACGPCIGMGQSPKSGGVSLRTFNRNFKGRSGTKDADIYLVRPGDGGDLRDPGRSDHGI